ncbi:sensor histidine kinase N-terminal domain-containing protein, partial [Salmonella enterica subsp. enterica serovar Anatum]|nr:sensor histidine kinase N-terminal domain-containing protein [Salmonella enterica subsp. enterica serovar Anatum]
SFGEPEEKPAPFWKRSVWGISVATWGLCAVVLLAAIWYLFLSRGEAIRVARLLQPVNEGGIIGMAEIYVAETLQSRRYLAGQLL